MAHLEPVLEIQNSGDEELKILLQKNAIALSLSEARKMVTLLGRNPTLTEATIFSTQGSEHSSYKSSRKSLKTLPTEGPFVILGPKEDAGIVELCEVNGEKYGIVYSHESHNSPSQIVPYEGAATGVGGICRDIACMGARVIGCMDGLRFGDEKKTENQVIARGVVEGVAGYANPLGVPNLGGDIFFEKSFDGFTLVNVVALGLVKESEILHSYAPKNAAKEKYDLIVVGKPSDRSGFGGASFSSAVVNMEEKEKNLGAVQEPNPFLERHLLAAFQDLFADLKKTGDLSRIAMKDMGAGGIMCATVELADGAGFGAEIQVENIHTVKALDSNDSLPPHIILCSETQERFCFAVPPDLTARVLHHFNTKWDFPAVSPGAMASKVGHITEEPIYKVTFNGTVICEAKAEDITAGLLIDRPFVLPEIHETEEALSIPDLSHFLPSFLARPNLADRSVVYEKYDQTVQGATVLERSVSESVVVAPLRDADELSEEEKRVGFAVSISGSPILGGVSSYAQGAMAVLGAIQKVVAVGGFPRSMTDCLNYGNPEMPEDMGKFLEGVRGVAEMAKNIHLLEDSAFPTPFISGNVSLYKRGNPSAIVSCVGMVPNVFDAVGNVPKSGETLFLLGKRHTELAGTEIFSALKKTGGKVIKITDQFFQEAELLIRSFSKAHTQKLLSSSAVIETGGIVSAFLQMCARSEMGFVGDFSSFSLPELFSEGNGFLVTVSSPESFLSFAIENSLPVTKLGVFEKTSKTIDGGSFIISKKELLESWKGGLREIL
ncbi:MAG: AIR synthase related protein [Candidatus Peregrinibacteria bacterium]